MAVMFQTFHFHDLRVFFAKLTLTQIVLFECGEIRSALLHLEHKEDKLYGGRQLLPAKRWGIIAVFVMKIAVNTTNTINANAATTTTLRLID